MFSLQKNYGEPNGIIFPDSSRSYLKEEKLTLLEGNTEVKVLVHYLTDLLLICDSEVE